MKIRDALNSVRRWPPVWTPMGQEQKPLEGEVGVLADVYNKPSESAIFMVIRKCSRRFLGVIFLKDCSSQGRILSLLQANVGRPIKEIGNLEF